MLFKYFPGIMRFSRWVKMIFSMPEPTQAVLHTGIPIRQPKNLTIIAYYEIGLNEQY